MDKTVEQEKPMDRTKDVPPDFAQTLEALAQLCAQSISLIESAESDTSWGQPTFGPTYSEEKEEQLEALHEPLADLFIFLSGKRTHASDCATSSAPAYLPRPCDCDVPDTRPLTAEIADLRAENERLQLDGIHTCHDECQRPTCVLRRQLDEAMEALNRIATVDMGGGFLGADACRKVAKQALTKRKQP